MKNYLLALLTVVMAGNVAMANARREATLEYKNVPISGESGPSRGVRVYQDGAVVLAKCSDASEKSTCTYKYNGRFSERRMKKIYRMIENIDLNKEKDLPAVAMCFMAPLDTNLYLADNGSITMREGHFCSGFTINYSAEAVELTRILTELAAGQHPDMVRIFE